MSLLSAFLKHAKSSVAFGRLGTAFVIAAALSAGALTSNCALAASDDGWFSAIDAGRGEKKAGPHVTVDIIAEKTSLTPQAVNRFAVRFRHQEGWHTYWKMPGDAGLPPEFTFTLSPSELKASAPLFPLPERTVTSGLITFGYGGETLFPFNVELPRGASGRAQIALHVEYLACKDMCIPESADVKFSIPIDIKGKDSDDAAAVAAAVRAIPERVQNDGSIKATIDGNRIRIDVAGNAIVGRSLDFLPSEKNVIDLRQAPQTAVGITQGNEPPSASLWLAATERFAKTPQPALEGVLVADGGPAKGGWAIDTSVPLQTGSVAPPPAVNTAAASSQADAASAAADLNNSSQMTAGTGAALLFAFLGGLILNLMPCVFPVLSLKLLDLVQGAHQSQRLVGHGLAFTGGVLLSMVLLSGTLMALRTAGHAVGWGFQLQSPWVVAALILLFGAITCNLLGLYEFTFGSRAADLKVVRSLPQSGITSSFFSGILAVIVASPCTAPFMGAGIGYALTQPAAEAMLVFLSLGLGMATPWLLLCLFPAWAKKLPKPGPWMNTFKKVMAVPMLLALLWLAWVLTKQVDYRGLLIVLLGLAVLAAFCWLLGRRQFGRSSSTIVMAALGTLTAASLALTACGIFDRQSVSTEEGWSTWSAEAVQSASSAGRPVFIDFTAAWCITCQANKLAVLDREEVVSRMSELGYVRFLADWTNKDPAITKELAKYGRTGVPLYVLIYKDGTVKVLPELLTTGMVLDALK